MNMHTLEEPSVGALTRVSAARQRANDSTLVLTECGRPSLPHRTPYVHDLPSSLPANSRVCLFGAGGVGLGQKRLLETLRPDVEIVAFADSFKRGTFDGLPILSPSELAANDLDIDLTVIASHAWRTIAETLSAHGISRTVRFCGLPEFVPMPDVSDMPSSVCAHEWRPYPAAINRYRICRGCGVIHKYLVAAGQQPHDDYGDAYWHISSILNGIPQNRVYELECLNAINAMGLSLKTFGRTVLEVGAGTGRLVPMFLRHGFEYTALERSDWAAQFITETFNVPVQSCRFEDAAFTHPFDLVVSFHTFEHLPHADVSFARLVELVKPGGHVFLTVPDGEDLFNPDHLWFFNEQVLRTWCQALGLEVVGTTRLRTTPVEDNIYLVARRP